MLSVLEKGGEPIFFGVKFMFQPSPPNRWELELDYESEDEDED